MGAEWKRCNWDTSVSWNWRWPCIWWSPGVWHDWCGWGRTHPDLAASALFTDEEWQGAYILAKKPIPLTVPTIREVIRQIAMLGGFLGRKGDGEPGVKTLWIGLQRVRDFVVGVEYMRALHDE